MICEPTLDLPMPSTFPPHPTVPSKYVKQHSYFDCIGQPLSSTVGSRQPKHANLKRPPLTGWGRLSRLITTLTHCTADEQLYTFFSCSTSERVQCQIALVSCQQCTAALQCKTEAMHCTVVVSKYAPLPFHSSALRCNATHC